MSRSLKDWLSLLEQRHPVSIDLGLERCGTVWRRMGSPRPAHLVYTVAGTNGKGSTVAYLDAILRAAGMRVGTYTSPHLLNFAERVGIGGQATTSQNWVDAFEQVEAARGDVSLTYFEFTTLAAFRILADAALQVAVLEVGLGGRLDTVNLVDAQCAVITPIGLDHQEYLGNDREEIGAEKAAIMRRGSVAVCGDRSPPASVARQAALLGISMHCLGAEYDVTTDDGSLSIRVGGQMIRLEKPKLVGQFQSENLATAVAALSVCPPEREITEEEIAQGNAAVHVPGRMQRIEQNPETWVDVGHNPLAAEAIATHLARDQQAGSVQCVLAMLRDKDAGAVVKALSAVVTHWHCAGLDGERGRTAAELADAVASQAGGATVSVHSSVAEALDIAQDQCTQRSPPGRVLVFGSFLTAAHALEHVYNTGARSGVSVSGVQLLESTQSP